MKAKRWKEDGTVDKTDVPDYSFENLEICREALLESVAETSEEYMDRYFSGDTFSENEIRQVLHTNVCDGSMVPISMASGTMAKGIYTLLDDIVKYLPSPEKKQCKAINIKTNEVYDADFNFAKAKSAYIFKTIVDPFIGKYSLMKICTGTLKPDCTIYNVNKDTEEKVGKLYLLRGKDTIEVPELKAGDIGAVSKLGVTQTGDTIALRSAPIVYHKPQISTPYTYMRYKTVTKGDEDKVSSALAKLMDEDLTLKSVNDKENRQLLLYGIGDQQLEVDCQQAVKHI